MTETENTDVQSGSLGTSFIISLFTFHYPPEAFRRGRGGFPNLVQTRMPDSVWSGRKSGLRDAAVARWWEDEWKHSEKAMRLLLYG